MASHSFGIQSGSCPHHEAFLICHCCSCHSPFQSLFIYPTELGPRSLVRNQLSGTSFPLDGMLATGRLCPMLRDSARDGFVSSLLPMKMDTSLTLCLWVLLFALIIVGSSVCIVGSPNPRPGWEKAKPVCHTNTEYSDLTQSLSLLVDHTLRCSLCLSSGHPSSILFPGVRSHVWVLRFSTSFRAGHHSHCVVWQLAGLSVTLNSFRERFFCNFLYLGLVSLSRVPRSR